jgi:molybdopterin-guanine dinucleotide biosynthesis protein A
MGRDKATIEIAGRTMAARVADALEQAGAVDVFFVGGGVQDRDRRSVPDDHPGEGPLGALVTALRTAVEDVVVVLACDLLDPSAGAIRRLVDEAEQADVAASVPVVAGAPQWLHGAWSRNASLEPLAAAFAAGERSIHRAAKALNVHFYDGAGPGFADADAPGDLTDDR